MKNNFLFICLLCNFLASCATQAPAPIESNSSKPRYNERTVQTLPDEDGIIHHDLEKEPLNHDTSKISSELDRGISEFNDNSLSNSSLRENISNNASNNKKVNHEVIEGENIASIARRYNVSVNDLVRLNDLQPPYILEELQVLEIPTKDNIVQKDNSTDKFKEVTKGIPREGSEASKAPSNPTKPNTATSSFIMPVNGRVIAKFDDQMSTGKNNGINISAARGATVKAATSGAVIYAGNDPKFGNLVIIKSDNPSDLFIAYAHLSNLLLSKNDTVKAGQVIGNVGSTGQVSMPQLHLAVRKGKVAVDPLKYLTP